MISSRSMYRFWRGQGFHGFPSNVNSRINMLLDRAKKNVTDQGGKVTHEFKLIKGFTFVVSTIESSGGSRLI